MPEFKANSKDKIILCVLAIFFCLALGVAAGYAQEETESASGSIASLDLTGKTITIEYVDESDTTRTLSLRLSDDIEVFNAAGLEEFKIGDDVSIDYMIDEDGKSVVVYLSKFLPPTE